MRMQVILDSSFARPGSAPIWGGKKGEFRDWTTVLPAIAIVAVVVVVAVVAIVAVHSFFIGMLFFQPRLNILIFLPILG